MTLWDTLDQLLTCAEASLADTPAGVPGRVFINPGGLEPWDNCCADGGQLWVRIVRSHPTNPFPLKSLSATPCPYVATQIGIGTVRCVHTVDDRGRAPSVEEMTSDAGTMVCDMAALYEAIVCCEDLTLDEWTPRGADGGCAGGEWLVWTDAPLVCPPGTSPGESP